MRILHTSDWHLGKSLEYASRISEQEQFIDELKNIVIEEDINLILISGDVYDSMNPSAAAEKIFYKSLKNLSDNGKRAIIIIAGNHDSPERLTAASPLLEELGIILVGTGKTIIPKVELEHFKILDSGEGFIEIELNGEKAVILLLPYPSEKRLNEIVSYEIDDKKIQKTYSEKIGYVLDKLSEKFRSDTINIVMGHFYVKGGEETKSERDIKLGGSMAVDPSVFPKNAQYIAMGHLHRAQKIKRTIDNAYYSGSPIQYSKSEIGYAKLVYIAEIYCGKEAIVEKRYLKNYKPIEVWKEKSIEDAIYRCEKQKLDNTWVFLEIETDRVLLNSEIKKIKMTKRDVIEIIPIVKEFEIMDNEIYEEKTLEEQFLEFYKERKGFEASEAIKELFLELINNDGG